MADGSCYASSEYSVQKFVFNWSVQNFRTIPNETMFCSPAFTPVAGKGEFITSLLKRESRYLIFCLQKINGDDEKIHFNCQTDVRDILGNCLISSPRNTFPTMYVTMNVPTLFFNGIYDHFSSFDELNVEFRFEFFGCQDKSYIYDVTSKATSSLQTLSGLVSELKTILQKEDDSEIFLGAEEVEARNKQRDRRSPDFVRKSSFAVKHEESLFSDERHKSPYRDKQDRSPFGDKRNKSPYRHRRDRSPNGDRQDRSPYGHMQDRSPYGHRRDRSPCRERQDRSPYRERQDRSPYRDSQDRSPYRERQDRSPYRDRQDRSPYRDRLDRSSYGDRPSRHTKIFVGHLKRTANKELIRKAFAKFGAILSLEMPVNFQDMQQNRGFCFINYANEEQAGRAIRKMDRAFFYGQELTVTPFCEDRHAHETYRPNRPRGLRLDDQGGKRQRKSPFSEKDEKPLLPMKRKRSTSADKRDKYQYVYKRDRSPFGDKHHSSPYVDKRGASTVEDKRGTSPHRDRRSKPTKIHVARLTRTIKKEVVQKVFSHYGNILSISIPVDFQNMDQNRGFCFIEYENEDQADRALRNMDGAYFHGQELKISPFDENRYQQKRGQIFAHSENHEKSHLTVKLEKSPSANEKYNSPNAGKRDRSDRDKCDQSPYGRIRDRSPFRGTRDSSSSRVKRDRCHGEGREDISRDEGKRDRFTHIHRPSKKTTIFVRHLTRTANKQLVQEVFACYGKIVSIDMPVDPQYMQQNRGFCIIKYECEVEADRAIREMDGVCFHGQEVKVSIL